jgi:hypothetical protein
VEFATRHQNGQTDGVIRSSIRVAECPPARIVKDHPIDRVHRLVGDPVAAHLMRPERLCGYPVGIQLGCVS